jgi:phage terminase large subunit GpA-like protein
VNTDELIQEWPELWLPPKRLPLSQWAERHFTLSPEYSATTGLIQLFGWQREIFDAFTDPRVQKIVLKVGTQLVKTLFIQAAIAYVIAETPGPVLLSQPKDPDAETFSKERLSPMIRDNECLRDKIPAGKSPSNAITYKQFPGGSLTLVGAMVPGNAARRSIQFFFADEINKYPRSVGNEGSFLKLAEERVVTFGSRAKLIYACSPTEPWGAISREYESSDQRQPWVACPHCGTLQTLKWSGVHWSKEVLFEDRPETAHYLCESKECGAHWNDVDRWRAAEHAIWKPRRPFTGTAGFWISHLYSPHKTLAQMVRKWLDIAAIKDANELKVFVTTTLAEEWQERGEAPDDEKMWLRREGYEIGVVPQKGLFLTAFVDVQDDRLEVEVKAWGRGKECWSVEYRVIQIQTMDGHPIKTSSQEPWQELESLLAKDWPHESGQTIPIMAMGIDSGFRPQMVYDFALRHPQPAHGPSGDRIYAIRSVVPTKGTADYLKLIAGVSKTDAARKRQGVRIWSIGTHWAKQEFYDALRLPLPDDGSFPMGYCHFPYPEREFYRGLCSESRVVRENGKVEWIKDPAVRNEPLDLHVGNRAMAGLCGIDGQLTEEDWLQLESYYPSAPILPIPDTEQPPPAGEEDPNPSPRRTDWFGRRNWF